MVRKLNAAISKVSMPSRAYTSFLLGKATMMSMIQIVSMPSRAYTSFLRESMYSKRCVNRCFNALSGLYLISTGKRGAIWLMNLIRFNALSGLYLISTVPLQKPRFYAVSRACFCRYLSEYSDNSRFSCMLTFWTYLMRCTYP